MTPRSLWLICTAVLAIAAAWALWPLDASSPVDRAADTLVPAGTEAALAAEPPFDVDAFRTPLWTAPPPPPALPAAPPSPPPVPPSKLRLLAIITGVDGVRRATMYDPDADRVQSLASGDRTGSAVIDAVDDEAVTVTDPTGTRTLRLRTEVELVRGNAGGGR